MRSSSKEGRIIGIRHRVKQTAEGEAHPTQVAIFTDGRWLTLNLPDEQAELDFINGRFPVAYRDVKATDDISGYVPRHLKLRELKKTDDRSVYPANLVIEQGKQHFVVHRVPVAFDGLRPNDTVVIPMGGSGDYLAYAISNIGRKKNIPLYRVPPAVLKDFRADDDKDKDAQRVAELFIQDSAKFYFVRPRDRDLIQVRELFRSREEAMKARIACEQRLHSTFIGRTFCNEEGGFPEGDIEKLFDSVKANDIIFQSLFSEEKLRNTELDKALRKLPVYNQVFAPIQGMGPLIAARIISIIGDIRLFWEESEGAEKRMQELYAIYDPIERQYFQPIKSEIKDRFKPGDTIFDQLVVAREHYRARGNDEATRRLQTAIDAHKERGELRRKAWKLSKANFQAFLGVHLVQDEQKENWVFPRKRRGARCNWNPTGRQALFLFGEQVNKMPDSKWGQRYRDNKVRLQEKHPEPVVDENGKKRYTKGHIHNMGRWRTLTQFAGWLFKEWTQLEHELSRSEG